VGDSQQSARGPKAIRARTIAATAIVLVLFFAVLCGSWLLYYTVNEGPEGSDTVTIVIPQGTSFGKITEILAEKGLIYSDIRFKILARLYGYFSKIRAGEFQLDTGLKPLDLLQKLVTAENIQHRITFAEGLNGKEVAAILAKQGWCEEVDFLGLIQDSEFIHDLGIGSPKSLEGYLYPDTYYITRIPKLTTREIITLMVRRFKQVWKELGADTVKMHETVILASIIEKETGDPAERPRIASVFHNRLKKRMKLQSDPTVIYGISSFSGNLTRKDLKTETPYNTYIIAGLPAGPIANPGKEAIDAALHPADENYLYFVSKNDGTHHFSKNLKEHNRAVNRYQRNR